MKKRLNCPACDSLGGADLWEVKSYMIRRCLDCKTLYVRDIPEKSVLDRIYANETYYSMDPQSHERIRSEHRRRFEIMRGLSKGKSVLDVGCATGLFLDEAASQGYATAGIELSPKNAAIAKEKGHDIFVGSLAEFAQRETKPQFALITCLDVIEHVESPCEFIELLSRHLSPDGILVITTPNYSGPVSRVLGKKDVFLTPPEHLNFFTFRGLLTLMNKSDLVPVRQTTFGRLTSSEMERVVERYFSKVPQPVRPLLRTAIGSAFLMLNRCRSGLEMEIYFAKKGSFG